MKIDVEKVTYKSLNEVVFGTGTFPLYKTKPEKVVTVEFSVQTDTVYLKGHTELKESEYIENVANLSDYLKKKINEN